MLVRIILYYTEYNTSIILL